MTIKEAIQQELDLVIKTTKENMQKAGQIVTGKMAKSLRSEIRGEGNKITGYVYAAPFFPVLETGRKPTPDKKPSKAMVENIREWADVKGLGEGAEWAIATTINKEGTKLWQQGGREDIFTPATDDDAAKQMSERVGGVATSIFAKHLTKTIAE